MIVVFFAGKARVGKTTAANMLAKFAKKNDMTPIILPFAKAIKDEAAAAGLTKDGDPVAYRDFCQNIGATKRAENPDHWVLQFEKELEKIRDADERNMNDPETLWKEAVVIVDDCRYLNEIEYGKRIGAEIIFIAAKDRVLEDNNAEWRNHESEQVANKYEADGREMAGLFGWIINNDQTAKRFEQKLERRFPVLLGLTPHKWGEMCDCPLCERFYKDTDDDILDLFFNDPS